MVRRIPSGLYLISRLQNELDWAIARAGEEAEDDRAAAEPPPPIDVFETPTALVVVLEAPGLAAADLEVEAHGNHLTLRGRAPRPAPCPGRPHFHCLERRRGGFERRLELDGALDTHRASARLALGLLRVEIPKIDDRRRTPRRIPVEDGET